MICSIFLQKLRRSSPFQKKNVHLRKLCVTSTNPRKSPFQQPFQTIPVTYLLAQRLKPTPRDWTSPAFEAKSPAADGRQPPSGRAASNGRCPRGELWKWRRNVEGARNGGLLQKPKHLQEEPPNRLSISGHKHSSHDWASSCSTRMRAAKYGKKNWL